MKKINLYFDFEFTSLSPDAQPVSLGIVSDSFETLVPDGEIREYGNGDIKLKQHSKAANGRPIPDGFKLKDYHASKSFYSEFSDFEMNRCDGWVKENVVSKLRVINYTNDWSSLNYDSLDVFGNTEFIIKELLIWLSQFKDYEITFVGDCLTWDWYHLLQLIGEWEKKEYDYCPVCGYDGAKYNFVRIGLPKLPENISPVLLDLNGLIAFKKGISVKEAFEINREMLATDYEPTGDYFNMANNKHNALWDAKIIKAIYENIK